MGTQGRRKANEEALGRKTFSKWPAATADPERTWLARLSQKAGCALLKPLSLTICPRCTALPARCTRKEAVLPVSDRPQSLVNQSKPAIFEIADTTWSQRVPIQSELVGTYLGGTLLHPYPSSALFRWKRGFKCQNSKKYRFKICNKLIVVSKYVHNWSSSLLSDYRN